MSDKQRMVIAVTFDDGKIAFYLVMREEKFGKAYKKNRMINADAYKTQDTFSSFEAAYAHVRDCDGELVDIYMTEVVHEQR